MRVFKAPQKTPDTQSPSVFLAGSIDMGAAVNWQEKLTHDLSDLPIDIYNPRRDNWDSSWKQDISNPKFREQVEWELDHLDKCDLGIFYFDPVGKAPITLMELGLHAGAWEKCIVYCPEGYWRRGNVQIVCARFKIDLFDNEKEFLKKIRYRLELML